MKALLFAALLTVGTAQAAPARTREAPRPDTSLMPLEQAATACFAETVAANPGATALARAGQWYEAAGITGFLCRPEVDALIKAHDGRYGRGSGNRYFRTGYLRHLEQDLAARLRPMLERRTVASAEPREADAPAGTGAFEPVRQKSE